MRKQSAVLQPEMLKHFCVSSRYQDMRRQIGFEIRDMWYNLGECLAEEIYLKQSGVHGKIVNAMLDLRYPL